MKVCNFLALLLLLPIATAMGAPGGAIGPGGGGDTTGLEFTSAGDCGTDPGVPKLTTFNANAGICIWATLPQLAYQEIGSAERRSVLFYNTSTNTFTMRAEENSSQVQIEGTDAFTALREMLWLSPNGIVGATRLHGIVAPSAYASIRFTSGGSVSSSMNASLTNPAGTGTWDVNFPLGTFGATPDCTCQVQSAGFCYTRASHSSATWQIQTANTAGTATDIGAMVMCWSVQP